MTAGVAMAIASVAFIAAPHNRNVRSVSVGFFQATGFGRELQMFLDVGNNAGAFGMLLALLNPDGRNWRWPAKETYIWTVAFSLDHI